MHRKHISNFEPGNGKDFGSWSLSVGALEICLPHKLQLLHFEVSDDVHDFS